ncbi:hypothetical protein GOP47_0000261 [Adiantum capillus-veneris]|uniref:Uncharacterized protein n=1 Tax=Adiantum capillus-veneris TaxID=13818 RepID=A0A9D4VD86_ADICA|nr:hypothetical protein GOP47_0000261 [Adiantum capillus-veneris]
MDVFCLEKEAWKQKEEVVYSMAVRCLLREAHQYSTARCAEASSALSCHIQHSFAARARRSKYFSVLERRRSLTLKKTRLPGRAEEFRCGVLFVWSF